MNTSALAAGHKFKVTSQRQDSNVVLLDLELDTDEALKAYQLSCRQLSHQVNIPGFRKGKAPQSILEKSLGTEYIKHETVQHLAPELLEQAIAYEKLDAITEPQVSSYDFEPGQPLKLQAKLEVRPEVELGPYRSVQVTVALVKATEEAIDHALSHLAQARATWSEVPPRPVSMGDTVIINFECFVDGKLIDDGKAEGMLLELKEDNFLEGFCEQLVGIAPGKKVEIKTKFPDSYRNVALAGKDATFQVELKGIRQKVVPEINDALAQALGSESLSTLKEEVRQKLTQEAEKENKAAAQRAVIDAVVAASKVEVPESMIEREKAVLLNQLHELVERNGGDWQKYQSSTEFSSLSETKHVEAKQRVLTTLVLGAVVRAENLAVTEEDLAPYFAEVATHYKLPIERITGSEQIRRKLTEEALIDKVVEYLVANAEVKHEEAKAIPHSHHQQPSPQSG